MIVVIYEEEIRDEAAGTVRYQRLGTETHDDIDEVMLPSNPDDGSPIFLTKKFSNRAEYRWRVESVCQTAGIPDACYLVTLRRGTQVSKHYYLKNILAARRQRVRAVVHQWSIVEVEFGHSLTVAKATGDIRSNKRYADTIQLYSMPKRRLAIVIQVIERSTEDLLQVIPITSKRPRDGDPSMVEVTGALTGFKYYQKQSWAACKMIQTVTASRVIAPVRAIPYQAAARDKGFKTKIQGAVRDSLKDAIMYGVNAPGRVSAAQTLIAMTAKVAALTAKSEASVASAATFGRQVAELQAKLTMYEQFIADSGTTLDEVREMYGTVS
ncbi:type II toxin-antitoxin system PemK/MazF family toxin [Pandoraea apista]|uniref:type II toxin-antitoxin system PemK/MazF family toxin n=1 Tax=Pandoraea apista TaxID=93218 RepID=UPI00248EBA4A|nr:type II toxin-antitoxin system PemK/MazF family toxin [Pandoraea apista]